MCARIKVWWQCTRVAASCLVTLAAMTNTTANGLRDLTGVMLSEMWVPPATRFEPLLIPVSLTWLHTE